MKKISIDLSIMLLIIILVLSGCYKRQKDYEYVQTPIDPRVNMSAKNYLLSRSDSVTPGRVDTTFRWMKKAIEYAGIDWSEYEKPDRTYIFLHNSAIRVLSSGKVTGGFFFDYPVLGRDANGNLLLGVNGQDSVRLAFRWEEYDKQTVKNYLLSLIIQGQHTFENLGVTNKTVQTLLTPGTKAGNDTKLSWVVTQSEASPDPAVQTSIVFDKTNGSGFDPEGRINLRLVNNSNSPLRMNDKMDARTGGILATNGPIHVFGGTVHPFRYSYQ